MPTPFPGMDPYLERPGLWEEIHTGLIVAMQQHLAPLAQPGYRVAIERRTYLALLTTDAGEFVGKPDLMVVGRVREPSVAYAVRPSPLQPLAVELPMPEEVVERYLEIRDVATAEVITVLELLSPANKLSTQGRRQYETKRAQVLGSQTHLIEIDLLRNGQPFPVDAPPDARPALRGAHYRAIVSRAPQRPRADAYLFTVRDPIPALPVPLRPGDGELSLPLNDLLHAVYERGQYELAVDYRQPPPAPPFDDEDAAWIATQLEKA